MEQPRRLAPTITPRQKLSGCSVSLSLHCFLASTFSMTSLFSRLGSIHCDGSFLGQDALWYWLGGCSTWGSWTVEYSITSTLGLWCKSILFFLLLLLPDSECLHDTECAMAERPAWFCQKTPTFNDVKNEQRKMFCNQTDSSHTMQWKLQTLKIPFIQNPSTQKSVHLIWARLCCICLSMPLEVFFHSSTPALTQTEYLAPTNYNEGVPRFPEDPTYWFCRRFPVPYWWWWWRRDSPAVCFITYLPGLSLISPPIPQPLVPPPPPPTPLLKQSSITFIPLCYHSLNLPPSSQPIRQSSSFWLAEGHPTPSLSVTLLLVAEQRLTAPWANQ